MRAKSELFDINITMDVINETHTKLGCAIYEKWRCPKSLIRIIEHYKGPDFKPNTDKKILVINLVCNIANDLGYGAKEHECPKPSSLPSAKLLQVDSGMIEDIIQKVKPLIEHTSSIL